jgi:hypothetical protein
MIQYVRASGIPVAELMDIGGQQLDIQVGFDNEKPAGIWLMRFSKAANEKSPFLVQWTIPAI